MAAANYQHRSMCTAPSRLHSGHLRWDRIGLLGALLCFHIGWVWVVFHLL
jgi:hypothetical protein